MDRSGRLVLVKSVLAAIPLHQILVLHLPKCILKHLEKIQMGFLWDGRAKANGDHCHMNWRTVSWPLSLGGLGVHDMERVGFTAALALVQQNRPGEGMEWSAVAILATRAEPVLCLDTHDRRRWAHG
jgi:hypothetical protein